MRMWMLAGLAALVLLAGCRGPRVVVRDPVTGTTGVIRVPGAPPPAPNVVVVKPVRPGPKYVWVDGHHVYRGGRYVWVKPRWVVPPRRGGVWVRGHYTPGRGWVKGHWR